MYLVGAGTWYWLYRVQEANTTETSGEEKGLRLKKELVRKKKRISRDGRGTRESNRGGK